MATLQQKAHWKDAAIAGSEIITDTWEVTKVYAGRIAEWVLFVCMVMNIIEILPGVNFWGWFSNAILGVQAVTLDIAGFGLASMADHARASGDEKAADRAQWTGYLLITIMVITVSLVTCGSLWPVTRWFTDPSEKVLILVRVVMTVIYGHVIHSLRRMGHQQVQKTVQSQVQDKVAELIRDVQIDIKADVQRALISINEQVQKGVQETVQSQVQTALFEHLEAVQNSVQTIDYGHLFRQVQEQVSMATHEAIQASVVQLTERIDAVQREVKTTVTEVKTTVQNSVQKEVKSAQIRQAIASPKVSTVPVQKEVQGSVQSDVQRLSSEPVEGSKEERVIRFILDQIGQGSKPTIAEIMNTCQVSKGTAIKYRRQALGEQDDDEQMSA